MNKQISTAVLALATSALFALPASAAVTAKKSALTVTDASVNAGRLTITGKTGKAGVFVRVTGSPLRAQSDAKGNFVLKSAFVPASCALVLASPAGKQAVRIANCKPVGDRGDIGAAGPAGARGPDGKAGRNGEIGPQGPLGEKGFTGPAGPVGPVGLAGQAGNTGPIGDTGPKGDTGDSSSFAGKIFQIRVSETGRILSGSPGITGERTAEGEYRLTFPRNVASCTYTATTGQASEFAAAIKVIPGKRIAAGSDMQVGVQTFALVLSRSDTYNPSAFNTPFNLQVFCL